MKVGPLDFPVNNANQLAMFLLLVIVAVYAARQLPFPASLNKFKP